MQAKEYRLGFFVRWCEGEDNGNEPRVTDLNDISGRDIHRYRNWRKDGINKVTLRSNLSDLRQFMQFCVTIDAVPDTIPEKITVPTLEQGENERDTYLSQDRAEAILDHLERFDYASLDHVLFLLMWEMGARLGGLHSLDVGDIDWEQNQIHVRHRPDSGTRLKNGQDGERIVALPPETMRVVRDYVDHQRTDATDDYGREPLFSSVHGRMHRRYLPKRVYRVTCPCEHGQECPSGKDPSECEYTASYDASVGCPHNTRPHDVRRGSITHWLKQDVPERVVSDRMNVSQDTLDRHYDKRTEEERADLRRQYLDDV
ncbi:MULTISPECIES: tyrosine-type recombinase/integrase [Salinibaculum]|uniref:tyrosine-type recombinase/integrase n=1 Tax=Salinibaculum TaxID=2732368 RepID=UPI0030D289B5